MAMNDKLPALRRLLSYERDIAYPGRDDQAEGESAAQALAEWIGGCKTMGDLVMREPAATFNTVQAERNALFVLLANNVPGVGWKSLYAADGSAVEAGMFLAGIDTLSGSIVFRLPMKYFKLLKCPAITAAREGVDGSRREQELLTLAEGCFLPY